MKVPMGLDAKRIERTIDRLFTPNGLMTAVVVILLSTFAFSGKGIEHRTTDTPEATRNPATISPLLGNP